MIAIGTLTFGALLVAALRWNEQRLQSAIHGGDWQPVKRLSTSWDAVDTTDAEIVPVGGGAPWLAPNTPIVRIPEAPPVPAWTAERRTPAGVPTVEAAVMVPGLQAVFSSVAVIIASGLLAWAFGWSWRLTAICGGVVLLAAWLWRLHVADSLFRVVETITRTDLDGDGKIGSTPAGVFTLKNPATAQATAARAEREQEQASKRAELLAFLDACYLTGTSESAHGIKATGPDRERYTACRDALMGLGLAKWKNPGRPKSGWVLTTEQLEAHSIVEKHVLS